MRAPSSAWRGWKTFVCFDRCVPDASAVSKRTDTFRHFKRFPCNIRYIRGAQSSHACTSGDPFNSDEKIAVRLFNERHRLRERNKYEAFVKNLAIRKLLGNIPNNIFSDTKIQLSHIQIFFSFNDENSELY